ncbi:putative polyhydroxybutyrate depolymerase [Aspergillus stella-maris]|uniref:putative polyhydroxybutyrate depolymerase n=1 Tax=Aspergillus stella-maris TaxID=1810926 RepID=UPI003CCD5701
MTLKSACLLFLAGLVHLASGAALEAYNIDPDTISISGFSSGGFMAAQLGIAYSGLFKGGFGVFAGGPYDCARNQPNSTCMNNNVPSIELPIAHMHLWSGQEIDDVENLKHRRIYIQTGTLDRTIGPNVVSQLHAQLSHFSSEANITYVITPAAGHTFPTDFDSEGNSPCDVSGSPYIGNCGYDGAGAVLEWILGPLTPRNTGRLSGEIIAFDQAGDYGASGMGTKGFLYVPSDCKDGSVVCRLHVVFHGCTQSYDFMGEKFVRDTGYNQWADTNNIIILYSQTTVDSSLHQIWDGEEHSNRLACWDWIGLYGDDIDQRGGPYALP